MSQPTPHVYALPRIHLNGTGADSLYQEYNAFYLALDAAANALVAATCNPRDFSILGPDTWPQASIEREEAFQKLEELQRYAEAWMERASDHLWPPDLHQRPTPPHPTASPPTPVPVHDLREEYAHLPWWQGPPPHYSELVENQRKMLYARLPDFGFQPTYQILFQFDTAEECAAAMHAHNSVLTRGAPSQYRDALRQACQALQWDGWHSDERRDALLNGLQILQMWPGPL